MEDEVTIISSVLELSEKSIESIMTPIDQVYTLDEEAILDQRLVDKISEQGFSRIPIFETQIADNVRCGSTANTCLLNSFQMPKSSAERAAIALLTPVVVATLAGEIQHLTAYPHPGANARQRQRSRRLPRSRCAERHRYATARN